MPRLAAKEVVFSAAAAISPFERLGKPVVGVMSSGWPSSLAALGHRRLGVSGDELQHHDPTAAMSARSYHGQFRTISVVSTQ